MAIDRNRDFEPFALVGVLGVMVRVVCDEDQAEEVLDEMEQGVVVLPSQNLVALIDVAGDEPNTAMSGVLLPVQDLKGSRRFTDLLSRAIARSGRNHADRVAWEFYHYTLLRNACARAIMLNIHVRALNETVRLRLCPDCDRALLGPLADTGLLLLTDDAIPAQAKSRSAHARALDRCVKRRLEVHVPDDALAQLRAFLDYHDAANASSARALLN